jgi:nuclear pore complex protein Nup85
MLQTENNSVDSIVLKDPPLKTHFLPFTKASVLDKSNKIQIIKLEKIPKSRVGFIKDCSQIFEKFRSATQKSVAAQSREYLKTIVGNARKSTGKEASFYSTLHSIWHLCHILLFDTKPDVPVLSSLFNWVQLNYSKDLMADFELVTKYAQPESHEKYWDLINTCLMRGYFDAVKQLLVFIDKAFVEDVTPTFEIIKLIDNYPRFEDFPTITGFKDAWFKWHQDAVFAFENTVHMNIPPIYQKRFLPLFGIISGQQNEITSKAISWPDSVLGLLFFAFPLHDSFSISELTFIARQAFDMENLIDRIHLSILDQDLGLTINLCAQFNSWLVTHLVDLLEREKLLEDSYQEIKKFEVECSITESFVLNFAELLLSEDELWETSLNYFKSCTNFGRTYLESIIPNIKIDSIDKFKNIIKYCEENDIKEAKNIILRNRARSQYDCKNYSQAILFYLQADDLSSVSTIVERILQSYTETGDKTYETITNGIPDTLIYKSNQLSFLLRYQEFQKFYNQKRFTEAAQLVVLLLTSGLAPKLFWKTLLFEILPMLEGQICVFTVDQLMELMRCVEIMNLQNETETFKQIQSVEISKGSEKEVLQIIKLALIRSLAAAYLMEQ